MAGWVKATASLYKLAPRLTGTGSFHHLLSLLLPHAALGHGLEQPGDTGRRSTSLSLRSTPTAPTGNSLFDLGGTVHEVVAPELEGRILYQLDEGDEKPPGVRPVHDQPLQQNSGGGKGLVLRRPTGAPGTGGTGSPGDLLLDGLGVRFSEQVEHGAAEVVGVAVRVTQLVGDGVQEQVTPYRDTQDPDPLHRL